MSTLARIIFTPDVTPPSVPVNVVATGFSQSTIRITWTASSDAQSGVTGYAIHRSTTISGTYTQIGTSILPTFDDTTLAGSQTRFYKVLATDGASPPNSSALSAAASATTPDQTAPGVPGTPSLSSSTTTSITLTWIGSTDTGGSGIKGYDVERNGAVIASDVATNSYSDSGLSVGTTYAYRIRARDNALNVSGFSGIGNISTQGAATWLPFTGPVFLQGSAGTFSFAPYIPAGSSGSTFRLASGSAALPTGVTLNSTNKTLDYNGIGPVANVTGVILEDVASEVADWQARTSGAGVVWYHNFDSANEVNAFRWTGENQWGNDPTSIQSTSAFTTWLSTDGFAGGGCLQIQRPVGTTDPAGWWRPYSPILGTGNGRGLNDPGANGTITPRAWNASDRNQNGSWDNGWYGPVDYRTDNTWDGGEYYIQFRVKTSATRWQGANNQSADGKLAYIAITGHTPTQEVLVQSRRDKRFYIYTAFGSPGPLEFMLNPQNYNVNSPPANLTYQPGGAYDATCRIGQLSGNNCWFWPVDEWVTVLIRHVPGHGVQDNWGPADHLIQIWVARATETSYTQIYNKSDYQMYFQSGKKGWNAFQASAYYNGQNMNPSFTQRYTQVIFSKQPIPCPQV